MRFYLFDRITDFVAGKQATGIKNVSSQEDFLIDHYERQPVMPIPLIIESLAQLGGWTVTVSSSYRYLAVMVMVKGIEVTGAAGPGDQIVLDVAIDTISELGASLTAGARVNGNEILRVGSIMYVLYEVPEEEREKVEEKYTQAVQDVKGGAS